MFGTMKRVRRVYTYKYMHDYLNEELRKSFSKGLFYNEVNGALLSELSIRNFAIIEALNISFQKV